MSSQENNTMAEAKNQRHFVLVHGCCHGAWCWYKLKPLLESVGHRVTALDMAASGINLKAIQEVRSFSEYTNPLLDLLGSLKSNENVILVGHSFGGMSLALAMENFPHKISVAVFVTAFMPDYVNQPSFVCEKHCKRISDNGMLDTQFSTYTTTASSPELVAMLFGPNYLSSNLYHLSPIEDLELAKTLVRPTSLFLHDLSKAKKLSDHGYGSVTKVYIVCDEDKAIPKDFQEWMIGNIGVEEVIKFEGSDHMPMFCKPHQLSLCLSQIAHKYA